MAAGLSPGATIPALQRLLEAGFVGEGKPGARRRTNHSITPRVWKFLKSGWRILIEDGPSGDLDADLRVVLLVWWEGGKRQLATDFLQQSASKKLESIQSLEYKGGRSSASPLADWYARLRSISAKTLLKTESDAATAVAATQDLLTGLSAIGRLPPFQANDAGEPLHCRARLL